MRLELRQWLKFTLATIGHHKAVALSYSVKKVLSKFSQNLQEKTCAGDSSAGVFL